MVARIVWDDEAPGSSPGSPTKTMKKTIFALLALFIAAGIFWKSTSLKPEPNINSKSANSPLLEINTEDWIRGDKAAPIILVEYGDFQCPACGAYYPILKQLEANYGQKLAVVWRHYPLTTIHNHAWETAVAAEVAGKQGKFWQMHDKLFENQKEWSKSSNIDKLLDKYAAEIDLDVDKFRKQREGIENKIKQDQNSGLDQNVTGTPTFFMNGIKIPLPGGLEQFKKVIDSQLANLPVPTSVEKIHIHFDFAVYADDKKVDFSGNQYMDKDPTVHFHDNNGEVVHIHQKGATLGTFTDSLDLSLGTGPRINGKIVDDWKNYEPLNLDKIVFGDGPVTDKACIYSESCPQRGKPPTEKCIGGLDTPCE